MLVVGLVAGTLSGVIGTGSSLLLMPVLVARFGPQAAVPVMAIAAVMGNLGKVFAWWRQIDWRACGAYCATAVPGAVWGVHTLLRLPPRAVERADASSRSLRSATRLAQNWLYSSVQWS